LEVFTDFVKLLIYVVFFTVSITFNGLPMHIMRDVYMTFASFSKRVADYVAYRKATSDMNIRYPDATTEEIRGDACIVCRETMVAWEQPDTQAQAQPADPQPAAALAPARRRDEALRAKKLPCGHILHLRCLKAWLERQQVCPTCRRPVVVAPEANAPGQQPPAGANNHGAPRQQPQHVAQRPGRARFFNLGPLRIGFLNGPGDQIGNIIRQLQNPQAPPAAAVGQGAAQPAANQQGPNHLGLQVPYANEQQPAQLNGPLSRVPTQVRMMQLEHQLMQDAHNLGVEQQQLATLRAMEAELARLRALHQPSLQGGGAGQAQRPAGTTLTAHVNMQIPLYLPLQPMMPHQQPYMQSTVQGMFHGNETQQFGNGHANLPEGLTLPEGWTAMALHRADGTATASNIEVQQSVVDGMQPQSSLVNGAVDPTITDNAATSRDQIPPSNGAAGPTDDNGSPLFVPTQPAVSGENSQSADSSSRLTVPSTDEKVAAQAQDERKAPWTSEGWSFVDPPNGHGQESEEQDQQTTPVVPPSANGAPPETPQPQQSYEGKGKGRAVEVEDAPDEGT
jgi:E3 ubiquitin-protein ligase synoviolin